MDRHNNIAVVQPQRPIDENEDSRTTATTPSSISLATTVITSPTSSRDTDSIAISSNVSLLPDTNPLVSQYHHPHDPNNTVQDPDDAVRLPVSPPRSETPRSGAGATARTLRSRLPLTEAITNNNNPNDYSEDHDHCHDDGLFVSRFNTFVQTHHTVILILLVIVVWPWGWHSFVQFQRATDGTFHAVPGSLSAVAQDAFRRAYSTDDGSNDFMDPMHPALIVVLQAASTNNDTDNTHLMPVSLIRNGTDAYDQGRRFSMGLLPYLNDQCWTWPDTPKGTCLSYYNNSTTENDSNHSPTAWLRVTSYYSLMDAGLLWVAQGTSAVPNGSTALIRVEYRLPTQESKHHKERIRQLMTAIDAYQQVFWKQQPNDAPNSSSVVAMAVASATNETNQQQQHHQYFSVHYTGIKYFSSDLALSTRRDLMRMDVLVLPLALVLIGIVLPTANPAVIWIFPLVAMLTTVSVWSVAMLYLVTPHVQISTFTPTIMMSLTLGMGIDYTLFLLSRYLEEMVQKRFCRSRSICIMLQRSGHVLVLSGLTLATTFGGLVVLPLSMLKSVGIGAAVTILSSLLVNLVVVPALLYTHIGYWTILNRPQQTAIPEHRGQNEVAGYRSRAVSYSEDAGSHSDNHHNDNPMIADAAVDLAERRHSQLEMSSPSLPKSLWFRMSKYLLHPYQGAIILLILFQLILPITQRASSIHTSISFDLLLPAKSPSLQTYHSLGEQIGYGSLNPYRVLFDGREANISMTSERGFSIMHLVVSKLSSMDASLLSSPTDVSENLDLANGTISEASIESFDQMRSVQRKILSNVERKSPMTTFNGIAVLRNNVVPHAVFTWSRYCTRLGLHCPFEIMRIIGLIDALSTSRDDSATYISATLEASPFSDEGIRWLQAAREAIDLLDSSGTLMGVKIYMEGSAGIALDAVNAVYATFPYMIALTTTVVFVLIGLFFKSCFQPLRSVVSICLTLSFAFGLTVLVFQDEIWKGVYFQTLTTAGNEVCWLVPILAFSIVVGLALDYDVFLIYRILEYRLEGYEHKSSVALGLDSTGGIITAAGVIMALAFGSLMFSSNPVLYQWSLLVTSAVLFDTFVVRSTIVPVLSGLSGSCCWWPRRLPDEQICFEEFNNRQTDDVAGLLRALETSSEYEPLSSDR